MEILFFILIGAILAIVIPLIDYITSNKNKHYITNNNKQEISNNKKQQQKEKILNTTKIILIVLWNILKWTLLIGVTLIVGLFSILSGTKLYGGAIQKRKTYKPTRNFWNKG